MHARLRSAISLSLWLALWPGSVGRAAADDGAGREKLAHLHFEAGKQAYELGRYADAALEFQRGYDLSPRPLFLLNLAHTYDRLDRADQVIDLCRRYLDSHPPEPLRKEASDLLASTLRRQQLAPPVGAPEPVTHPSAVEPAAPTAPTATPPPRAQVSEGAPPVRRARPGRPALAWSGVAMGALGVGGLVAATALIALAKSQNDQFNHPVMGTVYDHSTVERWTVEQNAAIGLFAVGGAALVAGAVAAVLGWRGRSSVDRAERRGGAHALRLTPVAQPGGAGALFAVSF